MDTKEDVREGIENCLTKHKQEIIMARFGLNVGTPWTLGDYQINLEKLNRRVQVELD